MVVFEVNEVTLYKMGVGWLSSKASFTDKEVLFPVLVKNQDDFLKTFKVEVEGEALLSSIAFDTDITQDLEIEQHGDAMTSLFLLLTGSQVEVETKTEKSVLGKLLGFQEIEVSDDSNLTNLEIVLVTKESKILHINSNDIVSIVPLDEFYKKSLLDQMEILSKSKKEDVKNLKISFTEEGDKVVTVSYLTSLPAWQSSYRLYSIDKESAVFELWSIVTNNSQQDWIDASMSLITGLPISFRYDISSPWIIQRPYVERPKQMGVSVMTPEAEYEELAEARPPMPVAAAPAGLRAKKRSAKAMAMADISTGGYDEDEAFDYAVGAAESAEVITTTESVAFSLKQPVTIKKGESALLLLHSMNIPKETINIYNKQQHASHPFKAIEVENITGYGWEEGPVTIYEMGNYAGESMLKRVSKGDKQIIPYLVEQDIIIKQEEASSTKKIGISLSGQYYVETYLNKRVYKLEIDNKSDQDKVVICEIPKQYGFELETKKLKIETKETPNYFRARIEIEPNSLTKLQIPTQKKTSESVSIASISDEYLDNLIELETITDKQATILKSIRKIRKEKKQINEQINNEQSNLKRIDQEYQRITSSIEVLSNQGDEGKTRAKYVERMNNLFETMEEKRHLIEELQERAKTIDEEIYKQLDKL